MGKRWHPTSKSPNEDTAKHTFVISLMVGAEKAADLGYTKSGFLDLCRQIWNRELKRRRSVPHLEKLVEAEKNGYFDR